MKRHILISLAADFFGARVGESLGIRYIKAFLNENGYEVDILENQFQQLKAEELAHVLDEYDIIGFSVNYCGQVEILKEVLNYVAHNKLIYLGGHFATICYKKVLEDFPEIDFIMLADGEYTSLELIQNDFDYKRISNIAYREGTRVICTSIVLVEQLDSLPFPYRDQNSYYLGDPHFSVISSRGCYNNCAYCSVGAFTSTYFNHSIRLRSAQNIYEELKTLKDIHHVKYITFQDDLFVGADVVSPKRAKELAEILIEERLNIFFSIQCSAKAINYNTFELLYKAGLRNVMIGIENFSTHALHCFQKPQSIPDIIKAIKTLRKIGVPISYGFIMYYPEMESEEILENIEILYDLNLINLRSLTNKMQIYIGTPYFERNLDSMISKKVTNYDVKYQFNNSKICAYIEACKNFERLYGHIESDLYRLEFQSHSNPQIKGKAVDKLFSEYRECLYCFSKSTYKEIFEGISNRSSDNIEKQMFAIKETIEHLYSING